MPYVPALERIATTKGELACYERRNVDAIDVGRRLETRGKRKSVDAQISAELQRN